MVIYIRIYIYIYVYLFIYLMDMTIFGSMVNFE